jgi:hypothetical protein
VVGLLRDDTRARDILFGTYWTPAGWRAAGERNTNPSDLEYAKAAGYMFEARTANHDEWVRLAVDASRRVTLDEAASAFVASLRRRRLASRSALGSVSAARHLAPHSFLPWSAPAARVAGSPTAVEART